jgi:hypothetical protein
MRSPFSADGNDEDVCFYYVRKHGDLAYLRWDDWDAIPFIPHNYAMLLNFCPGLFRWVHRLPIWKYMHNDLPNQFDLPPGER